MFRLTARAMSAREKRPDMVEFLGGEGDEGSVDVNNRVEKNMKRSQARWKRLKYS